MAKIATKTGQRVAKIRKAAGLTQAELGERSNLSQRLISNIECGQREGTIDTLIKIAKALDVTVTHLTGEADPESAEEQVIRDRAMPAGLVALARNAAWCHLLGITQEEWGVLRSIPATYELTQEGYMAILQVLRVARVGT
ncbi:MAG: helix-turn-helix transcriptional regulator [Chromatiaceae bacterium]|nr:helix-turn-helix transcriptional regulator [Chromatiaceae bacterium]